MCVPITSVVKYDIANLKLEVNRDYNFLEDISRQLQDRQMTPYKQKVHKALQEFE